MHSDRTGQGQRSCIYLRQSASGGTRAIEGGKKEILRSRSMHMRLDAGVYIHTYKRTYIHTYIHTYTHNTH